MKLLTSKAKSMIGNAVLDTYEVKWPAGGVLDSNWVPTAYLEEKGISAQNTGKNLYVEAKGSDYIYCNDSVERTTSWTGLVGLMSVSDITYANGWLYNQGSYTYPWSISSVSNSSYGSQAWHSYDEKAVYTQTSAQFGFFPSLYLNSDIKIIGGN